VGNVVLYYDIAGRQGGSGQVEMGYTVEQWTELDRGEREQATQNALLDVITYGVAADDGSELPE
jgi:hypothetical protein